MRETQCGSRSTYPCNEKEVARCLRRKVRLGGIAECILSLHNISDGVKCMQRPIDRALLSKL